MVLAAQMLSACPAQLRVLQGPEKNVLPVPRWPQKRTNDHVPCCGVSKHQDRTVIRVLQPAVPGTCIALEAPTASLVKNCPNLPLS